MLHHLISCFPKIYTDMTTQISPEVFYSNLAEEETPESVQPVAKTVTRQPLFLDTTPATTSDSGTDHLLVMGMVAIVGMVALCFIAYQRDKKKEVKYDSVQSDV